MLPWPGNGQLRPENNNASGHIHLKIASITDHPVVSWFMDTAYALVR